MSTDRVTPPLGYPVIVTDPPSPPRSPRPARDRSKPVTLESLADGLHDHREDDREDFATLAARIERVTRTQTRILAAVIALAAIARELLSYLHGAP